jgi:hypothetical protein
MKIFVFSEDMRLGKNSYEVRNLGQAQIGVPAKLILWGDEGRAQDWRERTNL